MARGDVADFVAQNAGQLRFVVHQGHQLAGGVDVAPRHGEGIVDRRIEQADGKALPRVAEARLHGDILAHLFDIGCLRPRHRAAEFGKELRVILRALLRFGLGNRGRGRRDRRPANAARQRKRRCAQCKGFQ